VRKVTNSPIVAENEKIAQATDNILSHSPEKCNTYRKKRNNIANKIEKGRNTRKTLILLVALRTQIE
jgi:hypothetical protein